MSWSLTVQKNLAESTQEVALSPTTLWRVMRKDLKLFPFRISTHHVLRKREKKKKIEMSDSLDEKLEQSRGWLNHI